MPTASSTKPKPPIPSQQRKASRPSSVRKVRSKDHSVTDKPLSINCNTPRSSRSTGAQSARPAATGSARTAKSDSAKLRVRTARPAAGKVQQEGSAQEMMRRMRMELEGSAGVGAVVDEGPPLSPAQKIKKHRAQQLNRPALPAPDRQQRTALSKRPGGNVSDRPAAASHIPPRPAAKPPVKSNKPLAKPPVPKLVKSKSAIKPKAAVQERHGPGASRRPTSKPFTSPPANGPPGSTVRAQSCGLRAVAFVCVLVLGIQSRCV